MANTLLVRAFFLGLALTGSGCQDQGTNQGAGEPTEPAKRENGFVAAAQDSVRSIRLEFRYPHDFVLTMKMRKDGEERIVKSDGAEGKTGTQFLKRRVLDEGGNKCVVFDYGRPGSRANFFIWTEIEAVSADHLEFMRIDRTPFCIVQWVTPAGIHPFPLNREGASAEERFQASGPIPFRLGAKWGYMDPSNTRILVTPRFDSVDGFVNGRALVTIDGKAGYIDTAGKYIVEPKFDGYCTQFGKHGVRELAMVTLDGKKGMINLDGEFVIKPKYDYFGSEFEDDIIEVHLGEFDGLVDRHGRVILQPIYERVHRFSEGLALVKTKKGYGYVDKNEKFVIPARYQRADDFSQGLAPVQLDTGKWGFIDVKGDLKIAAEFDDAWPFWKGLAAVGLGVEHIDDSRFGGKYGFIDPTGKIVIPIKYEWVWYFHEGRCEATLDGKDGWLYRDGRFEEGRSE